MVRTPESLAVLMQTKLTLVVAMEAGHDMLKATGLLFAYLPSILGRTAPAIAQVWKLQAANRAHIDPWEELRSVAEHQDLDVQALWNDARLCMESESGAHHRHGCCSSRKAAMNSRGRCAPGMGLLRV